MRAAVRAEAGEQPAAVNVVENLPPASLPVA